MADAEVKGTSAASDGDGMDPAAVSAPGAAASPLGLLSADLRAARLI